MPHGGGVSPLSFLTLSFQTYTSDLNSTKLNLVFVGFYINLPFGAVIIGILVLILHPPPRKTSTLTFQEKLKHLDLISVSIFIPAILMLLLAVQWGGTTYAWSSATIIGLFCGAAVTFLIFAAMQWHNGDSASIPSRILLQRSVFSASMVTFLCMGALQTSMYYLPVWFQVIEGVSPTQSGVRYLGTIIPNIIFAIVSGALGKLPSNLLVNCAWFGDPC